jgi:sulfur carrier protein ThiS
MIIHIHPLIARYYTENQLSVNVPGHNIAEILSGLATRFPKMKLFDKDGNILSYYIISVNKQIINSNQLAQPIQEKDEISIFTAISGG